MAENGKWRNRIIETVQMRVGDLAVNKYNPKVHPASQETRVEAVLEKFGIVDSLIAWRSDRNGGQWTIFDGHLRQKLDPDQVWTVHKTSLRDEEVDELVFYFDPLAGMSLHDEAKMTALMQDLGDVDGVLGEMLGELAEGVGLAFGGGGDGPEDPGPQLDRAAELQEVWQVERGQVWEAGEHFIICGDCRETETWESLLATAGIKKVDGVFTSPPYAEQRKKQYGGVPVGEYVEWWEMVQGNVRAHLARNGSFFVNIKPHCENGERVLYVFDLVLAMKRRWGWRFVDELCWKKNGVPGNFRERFRNDFEPIYHFAPQKTAIKVRVQNVYTTGPRDVEFIYDKLVERQGTGQYTTRTMHIDGTRPSNVVSVPVDTSGQKHPASFPAELVSFFIRAYSDPGDVWLDPFLGSGTAIVAAHQNERRGLGIEALEKYCAVSLDRLQRLGLEPRLVEDDSQRF